MKVETSDDKRVVPVSIHNISVVDELWSCIIWIIDYHNLLELLMLHICIEKEALVRIGFLHLYFFFLPHVGNGPNFSILILSFLCTVQSLLCAVEYLCMGLCAPRQTVNVLFLPLLSGGSHEPDCMDEIESRCGMGSFIENLIWIASCCWML